MGRRKNKKERRDNNKEENTVGKTFKILKDSSWTITTRNRYECLQEDTSPITTVDRTLSSDSSPTHYYTDLASYVLAADLISTPSPSSDPGHKADEQR